jgi:glycosyltransferase involved in cell wall biosynthesis
VAGRNVYPNAGTGGTWPDVICVNQGVLPQVSVSGERGVPQAFLETNVGLTGDNVVRVGLGPLVSVVIPAFNAQITLGRALRSVAAQTYRPLEIVIVDDASVDGTAGIAKAFSSQGIAIKFLQQPRNEGASAARNLGIAAATGKYVAFLDADDEWLPEKTSTQVEVMERDPDISFVSCEAEFIGPGNVPLGLLNPNRQRPDGADGWKALLKHPTIGTPCIMTRRCLLEECGGFDPLLGIGEDQDLWIRLALMHPVKHLHQVLTRVHDRRDSLSNLNRLQSKSTTLPMILKHMDALRPRLTAGEINEILGHRYAATGRHLYEAGEIAKGLGYLTSAIQRGYPALSTLRYSLAASPPAKFLKRFVRQDTDWANGAALARFPADMSPALAVVVDTEGEFDWDRPYDRASRAVESMRHLHLAQTIHVRHGLVPVFVVDYTIVESDHAVGILKEWLQDGHAIIGAHLQPWVNPPHEEAEVPENTYPGNLPFTLEYRKLAHLTDMIEKRFGVRPTIYKAGRYGLGPSTARVLQSLGYEIDASVLPSTNLRATGGPDFTDFTPDPFWFGEDNRLFEVPLTRGFSGALGRFGPALSPAVHHPWSSRMHVPGVLSRLGLLDRNTLTPEGTDLADHKRLTQALLRQGKKVFSYTYHSSSLLPGATEYIRNEGDRERFLNNMDQYFSFFKSSCRGVSSDLEAIRRAATVAGFDRGLDGTGINAS